MPLVDRLRARIDQAEASLSAFSARMQSRIGAQRVTYLDAEGKTVTTRSSWIRSYAYDRHSQTIYMTTKTGKTYSWDEIPQAIAVQIMNGSARCHTADPSGKNRWYIGKSPSLGAAFWEFLSDRKRKGFVPKEVPQAVRTAQNLLQVYRIERKARRGET